MNYNKQSMKEILIQRPLKTTSQMFYDNGLFDNYANAEEVVKKYLFLTRRRLDLEKVKDDDVIHWFCSKIKIK